MISDGYSVLDFYGFVFYTGSRVADFPLATSGANSIQTPNGQAACRSAKIKA